MKNSIFKKIVSVLAVSAMLITSTATVFAANDYASVSDITDWTPGYEPGVRQGVTVTALEDGTYKMERTIFKTSTADCGTYGLTAEAGYYNGTEMWYKASADGTKWEAIANPYNWGNTDTLKNKYAFADGKTFSKGTVQTKFDFAFEGDSRQCITVGFDGATTGTDRYVGARIFRDNVRFWFPKNGMTTNPIYYNEDKTDALPGDKTWYTAVLSYNIDTKVISLSIESRDDDSFSFTRSYDISNTTEYWGNETPSATKGVIIASYRGIDQSVVSATPNPASSVWYFDNVSLDAYTETNYELANTYTSGDGVKSNAPATGFTLDGITLSRLTNVLDPANASLITASYDGEGRMIAAQSKSLSQVGADAEDITVSGDTIKSFILDMNTAKPYINVFTGSTPATTVREIDFDGDYVLNTFTAGTYGNDMGNLDASKVHGYGTVTGHTMSVVSENGNNVLKSERSQFRGGSKDYYYDSSTNAFVSTSQTTKQGYYFMRLGKPASKLEGSFKVKFNGVESTGMQEIQLNAGTGTSSVGEYFLMFFRKPDGSGEIRSGFSNTVVSWSAGQLKENEWYTVDFVFDGTNMNANVTGIFGTAASATTKKGTAKTSTMSGKTFDYISIGSHRNRDIPVSEAAVTGGTAAPTASTRNTSIWYLDDFVVKY